MEKKELEEILCVNQKGPRLDKIQTSILLDDHKKIAVIAAAGSGKTMTMVAKVIYLIKYKKVNPNHILVLAFTNTAVLEFKNRLEKLGYFHVHVSTFHKLAADICDCDEYQIVDGYEYFDKIVDSLYEHDVKFYKIVEKMRKNKGIEQFKKELYHVLKKTKTYGMENILDEELTKKDFKMYVLKSVYNIYKIVLKNYEAYDFDDLIIEATKKILTLKILYRYIVVDEFQDISKIRLQLLEQLINKSNANLIIVGDDWQSVYGFSGSNISEFYQVLKENQIHIYYLEKVYRNSQELIDVAGKFIMKKGNHISKKLISDKHVKNPISCYFYLSFTKRMCFIKILETIIKDSNESKLIYILGRFQHDEQILKQINKIIYIRDHIYQYKTLHLKFLTIHSAKGLSANEIVIVNLTVGDYGFPSSKKNSYFDKKLPFLFENNDLEERRLFYVALTRTEHKVYLMAPLFNHSIFVKEIKKLIS